MRLRHPMHVAVVRTPRVLDHCRSHQQSELDSVIVVIGFARTCVARYRTPEKQFQPQNLDPRV